MITKDDPRYAELTTAANGRFRCYPSQVRVPRTTAEVVRAVQDAVDAGERPAARSGGHCLEDFVDSNDTGLLIDLSEMDGVGYDDERRAFFVEPGAQLGDVYRKLLKGWGVTIPAGLEATVGAGGHILGGGYGPLTRQHGCVVDHLYAVEVVVVDADGTAKAVVATREPDDPNHDLWWAHTGCGGGNFGIVTRYWFHDQLPKPPSTVLDSLVFWSWQDMTPAKFRRLMRNHGRWHAENSAPDSPYISLFSILTVLRRQAGMFGLTTQVDATRPDARELLDSYIAALNEGVDVPYTHDVETRTWLRTMQYPRMYGNVFGLRAKCKAAYLRTSFTDEQLDVLYRRLTSEDYDNPTAGLILAAYGGKASAVAPDATVSAQRDSVLKAFFLDNWTDPAHDDVHIAWIRDFYREMFQDTGGVPVPGEVTDGSYINYPDADLADPRWNTSGTPWHTLYYKDNYPRLQHIKASYDPRNIFHHSLSVQLPD